MKSSQNHHRAGEAKFDSELLLVQAKAGDGAATGRLLEHYRNYVGLLIRLRGSRRLRKGVDAEELFQEIGLEIHRKIATFRGDSVFEFLMWVRRMIGSILANPIRHDPRSKSRDRRSEGAPTDSSPAPARNQLPRNAPGRPSARLEQTVILADALDKLPEDDREVIILRHLEGLGFPEVARRLGRTEDSVKNVWLRALARLRRILEEPG